jgi:hypothetical protein
MANVDRMFRVNVAGGIALSATAGGTTGCGGAVSTEPGNGGGGDASHGDAGQDAFPTEGPPVYVEAGTDVGVLDAALHDAGTDADAFPTEGPNLDAAFFDTGTHDAIAEVGVDAFPQETAAP